MWPKDNWNELTVWKDWSASKINDQSALGESGSLYIKKVSNVH